MTHKLLLAALFASSLISAPAFSQSTITAVTGYNTTSGCPTGQTTCFVQFGAGGGSGGPATLAAGSVAAGAYVAGSLVDGAETTLGTKADAAGGTGSQTLISLTKQLHLDLVAPITNTGFNALQGGVANSLTNPFFYANAEAVDSNGTFTTATQTTAISNTNADGYATSLISIHGTYSGASGSFLESDDNGTTFYPVACYRTDGTGTDTGYTTLTNVSRQWVCPISGNDTIEVLSSAVASGTVSVRVGATAPSPGQVGSNSVTQAGTWTVTATGNVGGLETAGSAATGNGFRQMGKDGAGNAQDITLGTDGGALGSDVYPTAARVTATGATYNPATGVVTFTANAQTIVIDTAGYAIVSMTTGSGTTNLGWAVGPSAAGPFNSIFVPSSSNSGNFPDTIATVSSNTTYDITAASRYVQITSQTATSQTATIELRSRLELGQRSVYFSNAILPPIAPSGVAAAAIAPTNTTAVASNLVLKASAGNGYRYAVTTGASAGYFLIFDATTLPANGTVTPKICRAVAANASLEIDHADAPDRFSTGIVEGFSTTGCYTLTASSTAAFEGNVE